MFLAFIQYLISYIKNSRSSHLTNFSTNTLHNPVKINYKYILLPNISDNDWVTRKSLKASVIFQRSQKDLVHTQNILLKNSTYKNVWGFCFVLFVCLSLLTGMLMHYLSRKFTYVKRFEYSWWRVNKVLYYTIFKIK